MANAFNVLQGMNEDEVEKNRDKGIDVETNQIGEHNRTSTPSQTPGIGLQIRFQDAQETEPVKKKMVVEASTNDERGNETQPCVITYQPSEVHRRLQLSIKNVADMLVLTGMGPKQA